METERATEKQLNFINSLIDRNLRSYFDPRFLPTSLDEFHTRQVIERQQSEAVFYAMVQAISLDPRLTKKQASWLIDQLKYSDPERLFDRLVEKKALWMLGKEVVAILDKAIAEHAETPQITLESVDLESDPLAAAAPETPICGEAPLPKTPRQQWIERHAAAVQAISDEQRSESGTIKMMFAEAKRPMDIANGRSTYSTLSRHLELRRLENAAQK